MPMNLTLAANDLTTESLYQMYRASMEEYVNLTRGTPWNHERERTQFFEQISIPSIRLILVDGKTVGFVDFRNKDDSYHLQSFIVVPSWQSQGVGSAVLDRLMAESKNITLSVLRSNPRARSLYERKGFFEVSSSQHHYHLAWTSNNGFESGAPKTKAASR